MANKLKNKTKENEISKKNLKFIGISYTLFAISIFFLSYLKKYYVIDSNFSLIPFYWIAGIILFISVIVLCCKMNKDYAIKKAISIICINLVGIFFLIFWGVCIDKSISLFEFSKNATETTAEIYREVEKNITKHTKNNCHGVEIGNYCYVGDQKTYFEDYDYYKLEYIYHIRYNVNGKTYTSTYSQKVSTEFSSELGASKSNQAKYNKGDYITIYYNNDNPKDFRADYSTGFGKGLYVIELLIILFQVFYFIKYRKFMKEVTK